MSDISVESLTALDGTVDSLEVTGEASFKRMVVGEPPMGEGAETQDTEASLVVMGTTSIQGDGTGGIALSVDGGDLVLGRGAGGAGGVLRAVQADDGEAGMAKAEAGDAGVRLDVIYDDVGGCGRFLDESPRSVRRRGAGFTSEVKAISVFMDCPVPGLVGVLRSAVPCEADTAVLQTLWTVPFAGEEATGMFVRHSRAHAWSPWRELVGHVVPAAGAP